MGVVTKIGQLPFNVWFCIIGMLLYSKMQLAEGELISGI